MKFGFLRRKEPRDVPAGRGGAATPRVADCAHCGRPIVEHDRHVRFELPDAVFELPKKDRVKRTRGRDPLIQVQGLGAFVRTLLEIRLTDGYTLTAGTWLAIDPALFQSVWERWETAQYVSLHIDGHLANALPPWGAKVLGAPATATVRIATEYPYIARSSQPDLARVLATEWPHEDILAAYADVI
jgi:hypothetical protein